MKIDEAMRFPHPVLWSNSGDFSSGIFRATLTEWSEEEGTGRLILSFDTEITEPAVRALVANTSAAIGLSVICLETYFNQLFPLSLGSTKIEIPAGAVHGNVTFLPLIWTTKAISGFSSPSMHPEFGATVALGNGAIIAIGDQDAINVGSDKLLPVTSVFDLALSDSVPVDQIELDVDDEHIRILASQQTLEKITSLRNSARGRAVLLSAVYLPVVMEVLSLMQIDGDQYEDRRWHKVFTAKCQHLQINLRVGSLLKSAQTLLKSPIGKLESVLDNL